MTDIKEKEIEDIFSLEYLLSLDATDQQTQLLQASHDLLKKMEEPLNIIKAAVEGALSIGKGGKSSSSSSTKKDLQDEIAGLKEDYLCMEKEFKSLWVIYDRLWDAIPSSKLTTDLRTDREAAYEIKSTFDLEDEDDDSEED